ncbi:MAG: hypothetical protein FWE61_08950 [Micrococcales bacterium]|nr:hypothetical protein [Micrococcales bacterium]
MRSCSVIGEDRGVFVSSRRWATVGWVAAAVVCWAVATLVYWVAVRTSWGQQLDQAVLDHAGAGHRPVRVLANLARSLMPFVLCVVVFRLCVVVWYVQRRLVAVVATVVVVTVVVAMVLRDVLLTRPDLGVAGPNTLPSNHMAFTTALVGAVLYLRWYGARWAGLGDRLPASWRTGLVLGGVLVAEALVNVLTYAHRPADPVAGFALVAGVWSLAVAASPPRRYHAAACVAVPAIRQR